MVTIRKYPLDENTKNKDIIIGLDSLTNLGQYDRFECIQKPKVQQTVESLRQLYKLVLKGTKDTSIS